ncbi:MAG: hypothetical protein MHM6MM_002812 [Cercozoa sp. M6MM]
MGGRRLQRRDRAEPLTLLELRNCMKRDPSAWKDDLKQRKAHFDALLAVFRVDGGGLGESSAASVASGDSGSRTSNSAQSGGTTHGNRRAQLKEFADLVEFMGHVVPCYPTELADVPTHLLDMLTHHAESLERHLRRTMAQALMLLRARSFVSLQVALPVFFSLFGLDDKALRKLVFAHIVSDLARISAPTKARQKRKNKQKKKGAIQTTPERDFKACRVWLFKALRHEECDVQKKALSVLAELFRRKAPQWYDPKTVNAIAESCCFSPHSQVRYAALKFFLGDASLAAEDADAQRASEVERRRAEVKKLKHTMQAAKKKDRRQKQIDRALDKLQKLEDAESALLSDFAALRMLYDPQKFSERLLSQLRKSRDAFAMKLLALDVITRLVGAHQLMLFDVYSYAQQYLEPHRPDVTKVLACVVQATHRLVPPEVLTTPLRVLSDAFVSDRASPEAVALGLNTVAAVVSRQPLAIDKDLAADLVEYTRNKNKGVMAAARGLLHTLRLQRPQVLPRRMRGDRLNLDEEKDLMFGQSEQQAVPDADLLQQLLEEKARKDNGHEVDGEEAVVLDENGVVHVEISSDSESEGEASEAASGDEAFEQSDVEEEAEAGEDEGEEEEGDEEDEEDVEERPAKRRRAGLVKDAGEAARKREQAKKVLATRMLTQEDYERLRQLRMQRAVQKLKRQGHRGHVELVDRDHVQQEEHEHDVAVQENALRSEDWHRQQAALAREQQRLHKKDKDQWASKEAGDTNIDKLRNKDFRMVQRSRRVVNKRRRSQKSARRIKGQHIENLATAGKRARKRKARA